MKTLSKSKILAYRQCQKRLWLEVKHPEHREDSARTQASFKIGNEVGDLARSLYDPENKGELIEPLKDGFDSAFAKTQKLLGTDQPIFEAAFKASGALALADVLLPVDADGVTKWKMVEVKSSTSMKDYYYDDIAIQTYIVGLLNTPLQQVALACIDSSWVYQGDNNYSGILKEIDLTHDAKINIQDVPQWIKASHQIIACDSEPDIATGSQCDKPFPCGFYAYCRQNKTVEKHPVSWLPNVRSKKLKSEIIENDILDLRDVPDDLLNEQQLRVKQVTLSNKVYFDAEGAKQDLSGHKLPAYFIDFETIQFVIPIWQGTRPYQQICFQFSVHHIDKADQLHHAEFLDLSSNDPSIPFAKALIKNCGKEGPVYVYNAGFETARIRELAARLPELASSLNAINQRIVDLLPIVRKRYYHPSQQGSWSIKKVLPAVAPDLHYEELDGVQDGGMAMDAFHEAISDKTSQERKEEIDEQLRAYCALDTFAMVRLWQFLLRQAQLKNHLSYKI